MMLVPTITLALFGIYIAADGFGREGGVMVKVPNPGMGPALELPVMFPEAAITLPLVLAPFIAFCVMIGLQWSIKSKGTIGSIIGAVGVVLAVVGVLSFCGLAAGNAVSTVGAFITSFSPLTLTFASIYPEEVIADAISDTIAGGRVALFIGAMATAAAYTGISYGLHSSMKRTFMTTVRRLSGGELSGESPSDQPQRTGSDSLLRTNKVRLLTRAVRNDMDIRPRGYDEMGRLAEFAQRPPTPAPPAPAHEKRPAGAGRGRVSGSR